MWPRLLCIPGEQSLSLDGNSQGGCWLQKFETSAVCHKGVHGRKALKWGVFEDTDHGSSLAGPLTSFRLWGLCALDLRNGDKQNIWIKSYVYLAHSYSASVSRDRCLWSWLIFSMPLLQHRNFKGESCPLQTHRLGILKLLLPLQQKVGMERVDVSPRGRNFSLLIVFSPCKDTCLRERNEAGLCNSPWGYKRPQQTLMTFPLGTLKPKLASWLPPTADGLSYRCLIVGLLDSVGLVYTI